MNTHASDLVYVWLRVRVDVAPSPPWLFCQILFFPALALTSSPLLRPSGQLSSGHGGWCVRTAARRKDEMSARYSMLKRVVTAATLWKAY